MIALTKSSPKNLSMAILRCDPCRNEIDDVTKLHITKGEA